MHGLPFVYVHGATPPRTARGWTEVGMSVYKHVLVALGLITACGHVQASEPVPTAAAATAMFYGIELTDTKAAAALEREVAEAVGKEYSDGGDRKSQSMN